MTLFCVVLTCFMIGFSVTYQEWYGRFNNQTNTERMNSMYKYLFVCYTVITVTTLTMILIWSLYAD